MTPYMTVIVTAVLFSCLWQYFETRKQLEKAYIIGHTAITPHRRQICLAFCIFGHVVAAIPYRRHRRRLLELSSNVL